MVQIFTVSPLLQVIQREPWEHIKDEDLKKTAASFCGEIWQVPPMFSAIKVSVSVKISDESMCRQILGFLFKTLEIHLSHETLCQEADILEDLFNYIQYRKGTILDKYTVYMELNY